VWVGIDGFAAMDDSLIQAGIGESMSNPATDVCTPGTLFIWPWWEILPASESIIPTWNDGSTALVKAGDQVTVSISQLGATTWAISLTDATTRESFTTEQTYNGAGSSAEWIMEAPYDSGICGGYCSLPPYCVVVANQCSAPVTFSNLGVTGDETTRWQITMVDENGNPVSTPSTFADDNNFTVAYTGSENTFARQGTSRSPVLGSGSPPRNLISPIYN
jgi:hypothetical protein